MDNITINQNLNKLIDANSASVPQVGEIVNGTVISASKSEVKLDINGIFVGVIRGPELYNEAEKYANLKQGDQIEAVVIEEENENNELELSFKHMVQQQAWANLERAYANKETIKVKIIDANKGGLIANYYHIQGFLPVSQLARHNYPRVNNGDKSKILEKLKKFIGQEFEVCINLIDVKENQIIFSEKNVLDNKQKNILNRYKIGSIVEKKISAVTNFGVFIQLDENTEGLIHISELSWQHIDKPSNLFKVGDKIKAKIIEINQSKIFLSIKELTDNPWQKVKDKYKVSQIINGTVVKINPFGLFVQLDDSIYGLAHINQLKLDSGKKINELFKIGDKADFEIISIEPEECRLGLKLIKNE